jgi:hypothetical protein
LTAPAEVPDGVRASPSDVTRNAKKKEIHMKRRLTWLVLLGAAIVVTALCIGNVRATTADKFTSKTLYMGTFG